MAKTKTLVCVVVCDAGPLIHLDELDCLRLLTDFSRIFVPEVVWREVSQHRVTALNQSEVALKRISLGKPLSAELETLSRLFSLHAGETEALQIAREQAVDALLTDDTAARLAARHLEIPVHGTLGILLRAIRRRQMTAADVVCKLRSIPMRSTLHVKSTLLEEIIRQVEQL